MKTIMTIEITDEMVDAVAAAVDKLDPKNQVRTAHIKTILRTALPIIEKAVREQCERDLQECLLFELRNTATDEDGWLSDGYENIDGTGAGDNVTYCGEGSIDLHHIASLAAQIVQEEK